MCERESFWHCAHTQKQMATTTAGSAKAFALQCCSLTLQLIVFVFFICFNYFLTTCSCSAVACCCFCCCLYSHDANVVRVSPRSCHKTMYNKLSLTFDLTSSPPFHHIPHTTPTQLFRCPALDCCLAYTMLSYVSHKFLMSVAFCIGR